MTLQQLEYVLAVYRQQHFAKAADYCNVTQPTLSSMIQKLEDELGMKIFDRRKQPILPTTAGKLVIAQAAETLKEAQRLKDIVEETKHSLCGTFNIGILPTIAPYLIPRFFPQLMKKHPDMDVRIVEMKTHEIKHALTHGDINAGIVARLDDMEQFNCTTLFYEQFFTYVAKSSHIFQNSSIKTSDLRNEFLWILDEGHCLRDQLVKFCELKGATQSKRAYSLGSIETFMRIVESGKGVTFIPELALLQLTKTQRELVKPFALPIPTREIIMMTDKTFIRSTLLNLLIDHIRSSVPPEMLQLRNTQQRV